MWQVSIVSSGFVAQLVDVPMCQYSQLPKGSSGADEWPTTSAAAAVAACACGAQAAGAADWSTTGAGAAAALPACHSADEVAAAAHWPHTGASAGAFADQEAVITDKSTSGAPAAAEAGASAAAANGTLTDVQMGVGWDEPGCIGAYMAGL